MKRFIIPAFIMAGAVLFNACSEGPSAPGFAGLEFGAPQLSMSYVEGNPTCGSGFTQWKIEGVTTYAGTHTLGGLTFTVTNVVLNGDNEETGFDWSSNFDVSKVIVKAGPGANVYTYTPAAQAGTGLVAPDDKEISHITICYIPGGGGGTSTALTVVKFYDTNLSGTYQSGEPLLAGWKFTYLGDTYATPYGFNLAAGTAYSFTELFPTQTNWVATTLTTITGTKGAAAETVYFGNVCTGAGGGRTIGFWSNKNGQARMGTGAGMTDALAGLDGLNLWDADGLVAGFDDYAAFRSWLQGASASEMNYMLSAQLAAMWLNVNRGWVTGTTMIYAPGVGTGNFVSVADLITTANIYLGGTEFDRARGELLKDALDAGNNDTNFVQSSPCAYTFP
jgi:hypothetical protein